jgi:CDP-diacylglycerol--glycerol-3-phosphate 3-phosphatidyltransferase
MFTKAALPNLLTVLRLLLTLVMFACFAAVAWVQEQGAGVDQATIFLILRIALAAFVIAAVTDFFDGWLARLWKVESLFGAILDPIADKILVCAAAIGLIAVHVQPPILIPVGIILFREFAVSALREVLAPRGLILKVTALAKIKTALQLIALGALMVAWFAPAYGLKLSIEYYRLMAYGAHGLIWLAAGVTLWTGVEYGLSANRALKDAQRVAST